MKVDEWLTFFRTYDNKKLFSFYELLVLTGVTKKNLSVQLNRLIKAKVINRSVRNWYENPFNPPSIEEIGMVLRQPSYVSMEYALYKQDIISQQVHILTFITIQLPYTYQSHSHIIEFHQMKKSLFWGYQKQGIIQIAEAEKAFLDFIYLRYSCNRTLAEQHLFSFVDSMYLEELNKKKLQRYVQKFDRRTKEILNEIMNKFV